MLEIFRSNIPVGSGSGNTEDSSTGTSEQESSRIKRLEKLIKKPNTVNILFYSTYERQNHYFRHHGTSLLCTR